MKLRAKPRILAVGGAHIDRRGQVAGEFVPGASNPGTMREYIGGAAFNALRSAVGRGAKGMLFSVRGGDAAGDAVHDGIVRSGIVDLSAVFLDRATASYTALLDRDGDLIAGLADMGLYDVAFPKQIGRSKLRNAVAATDAILCDTNLPAPALARLVRLAEDRPLFSIAVSPAKVTRLEGLLSGVSCLFMNRRESGALSGATDDVEEAIRRLRAQGLAAGVITDGAETAYAFDPAGICTLSPPMPDQIVDVTGAGDAMAGSAMAALLRGMPLGPALREGAAAALLAIECGASVPDLRAQLFARALARVPEVRELGKGGKI